MPQAWVHAVFDLVVYGRPYLLRHQLKDSPWRTLGPKHRVLNHPYYHQFNKVWDFNDPFPKDVRKTVAQIRDSEQGEYMQSWYSHDYLDRLWNTWNERQRKRFERFCMYLVRRPKTLKEWAGVDVKTSRIKRLVDGKEIWEETPGLRDEWEALKRYVKIVKISKARLERGKY